MKAPIAHRIAADSHGWRFVMKTVHLLAGTLVLVPASVALLAYFSPDPSANAAAVLATYSNGALHVSIPHSGSRAGGGNLAVEILDPEDRVVEHAIQRAATAEK